MHPKEDLRYSPFWSDAEKFMFVSRFKFYDDSKYVAKKAYLYGFRDGLLNREKCREYQEYSFPHEDGTIHCAYGKGYEDGQAELEYDRLCVGKNSDMTREDWRDYVKEKAVVELMKVSSYVKDQMLRLIAENKIDTNLINIDKFQYSPEDFI